MRVASARKALLVIPDPATHSAAHMNRPHVVDFRQPTSLSELAICLGVDVRLLERVVSAGTPRMLYVEHRIPKRSRHRTGDFRTVWEVPDGPLADAHKAFARRFELFLRDVEKRFPHEAAYGYVRGRSTWDNAKNHCGAPLLLRADLVTFSPLFHPIACS